MTSPTNSSCKTFIPLENNPEVLTPLARSLGLTPRLVFHDLYSFTNPDLLSLVPRPAHALLFVYPCTPTLESFFLSSNAKTIPYPRHDHPILWFPQTINHACGLIGLVHCLANPNHHDLVLANSPLDNLIETALPLAPSARADLLSNSSTLESLHAAAAARGDSTAPALGVDPGHAFVAFVKGRDGHLWEVEGRGNGPNDLGVLREDEDVLSPRALERGCLRYIWRQESGGGGERNVRFSATVLASVEGEGGQ